MRAAGPALPKDLRWDNPEGLAAGEMDDDFAGDAGEIDVEDGNEADEVEETQ